MILRFIAFVGISFVAFLFGCNSSIAGSASSPVNAPSLLSADASLRQLQSQGTLPTLDVSTSLLGTDSDGNGIRDDIDKYIGGLPDTPSQKKALIQSAKALQGTLAVDTNNPAALQAAGTAIDRGEGCIWVQYTSGQPQKGNMIEAITINTLTRLKVYERFNAAFNGSVVKLPASPCD